MGSHKESPLEISILALNRQIVKCSANEESLYFRGGKQWFLKVLVINLKTSVGLLAPRVPSCFAFGFSGPNQP